ncbi:hypothetical protein PPL_10387 [Heterostelium album PN500]|uniref:LysM domain-containing protein n=1 Tax=Heterostelium pallidum (strain ATCC 26659 / Pp 5 / PN500) TaxID=670386 RepID=D3BQY4_HETP5|nr:hypothetical protein PPL_10387 [Heterostelium album PN500]EFA76170.1 hypothetical protein PPL_10387 [Heterostelium album PN500]|eukprot:XP_020428303.1 hypothetical protein PPL_10387 [Heterostelium album PN500]
MSRELRTKNIESPADGFRYIEHVLQSQDTLQGLALKYSSTVGDIKRVNKIWKDDTLFLKKSLFIPIKIDEDSEEGSSSSSSLSSSGISDIGSSSSNSNNSIGYVEASDFDEYKQKRDMIKAKNVDFFSEFNSKSNYNLNNVLNNKPLPSGDDDHKWKSVPISILSLSPVIFTMELSEFKCCLIGDDKVGKTSLLKSYSEDQFTSENIPVIVDNYYKHLVVDGNEIKLGVWDTACTAEYDLLRPLSYSGANVFLLCFSVISVESLQNISNKWIPEVNKHQPSVPFILVGTKIDLRNEFERNDKQVITHDQGTRIAQELGAINYLECSALTLEGLVSVFEESIQSTGRLLLNKNTTHNTKDNKKSDQIVCQIIYQSFVIKNCNRDDDTGKTSFVLTFARNKFPTTEKVPKVFDGYHREITFEKRLRALKIWDTSAEGENADTTPRPRLYRFCKVFLVCFNIGSLASFENAEKRWVHEVNHYRPTIPVS